MTQFAINTSRLRALATLMLLFGACSLVHFVHNAELIAEYPNLLRSWMRADVYLAWLVMTAIGLTGWLLASRGFRRTGLALIAVYAACGLDSLGHYMLAPLAAHTLSMNATILLEVTSAALVLVEVGRLVVRRLPG
jgi:hypothetical protein